MKPVSCVFAAVTALVCLSATYGASIAAGAASGAAMESLPPSAGVRDPAGLPLPLLHRYPRATCDLLSFSTMWVTVNHAACAAHCLALRKGFKGGRCVNAVCVCRK